MPITKHSGHYCTYKTITGQSRSFLRLENSFGTVWSLSFAYVHIDEVYPETFGYVCAERKTCLQVPRNKQTKVYICTVHWVLSLYIYSNTCFGRVDGKQSPGRSCSLLLQKEFILEPNKIQLSCQGSVLYIYEYILYVLYILNINTAGIL